MTTKREIMTKQKQNLGTILYITRRFDAILPSCRKNFKRDAKTIGYCLKGMGYGDVTYHRQTSKNVEIRVRINNSTQMDEIRMEVEEYFPEFKILQEVL